MTIPRNDTHKNTGNNNSQLGLMTPLKASHNGGCDDERIIALVKYLARRAAIEDFQMYTDAIAAPDKRTDGKWYDLTR